MDDWGPVRIRDIYISRPTPPEQSSQQGGPSLADSPPPPDLAAVLRYLRQIHGRFLSNLRVFVVTGINWGVALFIARTMMGLVATIFSRGSSLSSKISSIVKELAMATLTVTAGAFFITILGELCHPDFTAVSLIGTTNVLD